MSWKNASIQSKIIFTGVFVVIMFTSAVFFYFIPSMKNAIIETKKEKIRDIIDCAAFTIEGMYRDFQEGKISEETFKNNVIDYVRNVRYGPGGRDYLWLNDLEPKMIFHPYRSDLNGKNIAEHKDPSGKQFFIEMVNICRASGGGFVQYMWQYKDDTTKIVPKISYVRLINNLNWIIGTGVYELDVYEEIQARVHTLEARIGLVVAAITIVLVLFVYFISRSIKQNIGRCVHTVQLLSEGDLTQRVKLDQKDEIGQMAAALDRAIDDIEKLISSIILSSQNLAQAVEQISAGNQNLSQRTNEQATSIEEIASTIEETTATVNQNAGNSSDANRLAVSAAEAIKNINEKSRKIVDIITVINDIAFQTNLLALNAAVEAARAGDQGRGFAVVAGEVRNLAQRSGNSAKEIEILIRDTVESVQTGTNLVNEVSKLVSEIAFATEEQKQGINQINVAITEMDTMTQQNASLVEETASASEEMANQAQELMDMVQVFRVNVNTKSEQHKQNTLQTKIRDPRLIRNDGNGKNRQYALTPNNEKHEYGALLKKDVIAKEGFEEF